MIRQPRTRFHDIPPSDLISVIEALCHNSIEAFPVYECVKVFARVTDDGQLTYARHKSDLGTTVVPAQDIVSRFRNDEVRETTAEALRLIEENLTAIWPFAPGSSSWLQLEILDKTIRQNGPINRASIVFRKAVRLSSTNEGVKLTSTPLIERMFSQLKETLPSTLGRFSLVYQPSFTLKNIAGSGLVTESKERLAVNDDPRKVAEDVANELIRINTAQEPFLSPGFSFVLEDKEYQVTSRSYGGQKKEDDRKRPLPIPMVGVVR